MTSRKAVINIKGQVRVKACLGKAGQAGVIGRQEKVERTSRKDKKAGEACKGRQVITGRAAFMSCHCKEGTRMRQAG